MAGKKMRAGGNLEAGQVGLDGRQLLHIAGRVEKQQSIPHTIFERLGIV